MRAMHIQDNVSGDVEYLRHCIKIRDTESWNRTHKERRSEFLFADLSDSVFDGAMLPQILLAGSILVRSSFVYANLDFSVLRRSFLTQANFAHTSLRFSDLRECNLVKTNFRNADLTGAKIWGVTNSGWEIEGAKCDYIYLDQDGKKRYPEKRDFYKGEFERMFKQWPTLEIFFEKGLNLVDIAIVQNIVSDINRAHPLFDLELVGIDIKATVPRMQFRIASDELAEEAEKRIAEEYQKEMAEMAREMHELRGENKALSRFNERLIMETKNRISIGTQNIHQFAKQAVVNQGEIGELNFRDGDWSVLRREIESAENQEELSKENASHMLGIIDSIEGEIVKQGSEAVVRSLFEELKSAVLPYCAQIPRLGEILATAGRTLFGI